MSAWIEGKVPGQTKAEVAAGVSAGLSGVPEDLTRMVVFFASSEAGCNVSHCDNVDGGQWMN